MTRAGLDKFLALASSNDDIARELSSLGDPKAVIELGARYGCAFTAEDLAAYAEAELSDDELDSVAGGFGDLMATLFYVSRDSIEEDGGDGKPQFRRFKP